MLKELLLSFLQPSNIVYTPLFFFNNTSSPALEKLELSMARLSVLSIIAILSKSKESLTGISFRLVTLTGNLTWAELLRCICNEYPHLTWFKLGLLSEGPDKKLRITFSGLDEDSVIGEPPKSGLKLVQKRPVGAPSRIPVVEYEGSDANHVLRIVAKYAAGVPV